MFVTVGATVPGPVAPGVIVSGLVPALVGDEKTVAKGLRAFADRTRADELMITAQIWDDEARLRSLEIAAAAAREA